MPIPLPTLPEVEPLLPTKTERLTGTGPSLFRRVGHFVGQLVPNPMFVWRWIAAGAFGSAAILALGIALEGHAMDQQSVAAREERSARNAEIKRKADLEAKKQKDQASFEEMKARALANWDGWREQFTNMFSGILCAQGHIFNEQEKVYTVTCQVGVKGSLPTHVVVCNQGGCAPPQVIPDKPEKK